MLIFLVFTLLLSTNLESSKALSLPPQPQTSGSITQATDNELESRTMWSIISACASTTFLCTWSSVHPNVPPEEGALRRLCRRLRLMFWALVVPELVLAWSAKQWYVAGRIAHTYNSNKGEIDLFKTHRIQHSGISTRNESKGDLGKYFVLSEECHQRETRPRKSR